MDTCTKTSMEFQPVVQLSSRSSYKHEATNIYFLVSQRINNQLNLSYVDGMIRSHACGLLHKDSYATIHGAVLICNEYRPFM